MQTSHSQVQKRATLKKNTLETLSDIHPSIGKKQSIGGSFADLGGGIVNQLFGIQDTGAERGLGAENVKSQTQEKARKPLRKEFTLFNYNKYYEQEVVKNQIKQLTEAVKKEIDMFKQANASLMAEVKDVQNSAINEIGEKVGIYHIRFLELVLSLLRTLRAKVGESRTWMQALMSKKKKRGSLFAINSKKKGTQYSMSQELTITRSVQ